MDPFKTDSSLYSYECPFITDEEFNLFHTIDRELFSIIVLDLGCNPDVAMQVMALLMWLENQCTDIHLIRMLRNMPYSMLRQIVEEAFVCLKCAENDTFVFDGSVGISLLPEFMNTPFLSLGYFHENGRVVLKGVSDIRSDVCERAFRDILQQRREADSVANAGGVGLVQGREVAESSRMGERRNMVGGGGMMVPPFVPPQQPMQAWQGNMGPRRGVPPIHFVGESSRMAERRNEVGMSSGSLLGMPHLPVQPVMPYGPYLTSPIIQIHTGSQGSLFWLPAHPIPTPQLLATQPFGDNVPSVEQGGRHPMHRLGVGRFPAHASESCRRPVHDREGQRNELRDTLVLGNMEEIRSVTSWDGVEETGVDVEQILTAATEEEVPPADRTIFLTFSRGYPVTAEEVRDFFTRKFGDFIEDLIMQDVRRGEQLVYARMVARSASVIPDITEGSRVKYNINGKHVMARKFVKNSQDSVGASFSSQRGNGQT